MSTIAKARAAGGVVIINGVVVNATWPTDSLLDAHSSHQNFF